MMQRTGHISQNASEKRELSDRFNFMLLHFHEAYTVANYLSLFKIVLS